MKFDRDRFRSAIEGRLGRQYGKSIEEATKHDIYDAVVSSVMDIVQPNWVHCKKVCRENKVRQMYYLSAEFLMGRMLSNNLINLGIYDGVCSVLKEFGIDYNVLEEEETDAGLGNGGLGRLAACFLDSLATLEYPGHGYGIRYKYGMFEQRIENGYQVEYPDNWLQYRDPWETRRADLAVKVLFGGNVVSEQQPGGRTVFKVVDAEEIVATPYDMPIIGFDSKVVNHLRLWEASSENGFDLQLFNDMNYSQAVEKQNRAEDISRVLYPNDSGPSGKTLRLKQQYFFVSASLQDLVAAYKREIGDDLTRFAEYNVIQLNDTHPVIAIPELMRILMDENGFGWDDAWQVTTKTFAYTNHTILAEALEKWPIDIIEKLLPRIYQIITEINRRFCDTLREKFPGDWEKQQRMSIVGGGVVKMAWLAIAGCFSVNGVAALHTEILKNVELADWNELFPKKFNNKTNGVTQRRWLACANPSLADFITKRTGAGWEKDLYMLKTLEKYADDKASLDEFMSIKRSNKERLARFLKEDQNVFIDPDSIFDVQIKRLHEYKRQLLNVLHIMYLYNRIIADSSYDPYPRTFVFGAKAASGYRRAKNIIKLINTVADRVNNDYRVKGRLRVVFIPNYRVSLAEKIFPASDVSEQISTAGKEASGTGNMKFMLNGAVTLGTMDGANIEIAAEAGAENIFIFGLTAEEIQKIEAEHTYNPQDYLARNQKLAETLSQLVDGTFSASDQAVFRELYDSLVYGIEGQRPDVFYVLADFDAYAEAHEKILEAYSDKYRWAKMALLNVARAGKFSSDRTIEEYVRDIWKLKKLSIT